MRYIMVTDWDGHWDGLINNSTYYTTQMFGPGMNGSKIKDNTPTIFIKKNRETGQVEKAWNGSVNHFRKTRINNKIRVHFKVKIDEESTCPLQYASYPVGWHVELDNRS